MQDSGAKKRFSSLRSTEKDVFLDSFAEAGTVESVGEQFTLHESLALKKLTNVLVDREQWVLKAVQAGVAGQASSVSFGMGRESTKVIWWGVGAVSAEELRTALSSPTVSSNLFLAELVIGLRALLGHEAFRFVSDGALTLSADRKASLKDVASRPEAELTVWHAGTRASLGAGQRAKDAAARTRYLSRYACFAPIPIYCDRRLVQRDSGTHQLKQGSNQRVFPLFDLGLVRSHEWSFSALPGPSERFHESVWQSQAPIIQPEVQGLAQGRFQAWLPLENINRSSKRSAIESAEVVWLRHGVVCRRDIVLSSSRARFILALEAQSADGGLDGLSLSDSQCSTDPLPALFSRLWSEVEPSLRTQLSGKVRLPPGASRSSQGASGEPRPAFVALMLLVVGGLANLAVSGVVLVLVSVLTGGPNSGIGNFAGILTFVVGTVLILAKISSLPQSTPLPKAPNNIRFILDDIADSLKG